MCYNDRLGSLLTLKLSTMQSKCIVPFSCQVTYKTRYILLACVPFSALRTTLIVAILQAPDGKDSGQNICCNTYIPHDSQLCMGKYKAYA